MRRCNMTTSWQTRGNWEEKWTRGSRVSYDKFSTSFNRMNLLVVCKDQYKFSAVALF
jgi:hypothetical protein